MKFKFLYGPHRFYKLILVKKKKILHLEIVQKKFNSFVIKIAIKKRNK